MSQAGDPCEDPEEVAGPSVESDNSQERIAARRIRIAARNEAKKGQEHGDDTGEKEVKEKARKSHQQVEQSQRRMINLQSDGTALVTNIQMAADARESQRRAEMQEARRLRVEKLENEAKSSLEKYEEVTRKWTVTQRKVIPQELWDALNSQQQLCDLILEEKNKLISDLQQELKASDDLYVKDLRKQSDEVDLMIERMEEQIKTLMKTYREELDRIENAYEQERKILLTGNMKNWEQHMMKRRDKELDNLKQRMRKVEEYGALLQHLRVEDAEEYNMIKIKLDTTGQTLQQQLQQRKATYQLSQEQLEYNYQVLQKRDEENIITKSQQKRKINRLQDALNNLKIKCSHQKKQSEEEIQNLSEDYKRAMQQYKHIQKKARHFAAIDAKKFEEVWLMNEAEVKQLVERALDIDRLIHEHQLGLAWERPRMAFMERSGPVQPQKRAQRTARQAASQLIYTGDTSQASLGMRDASVGPGPDSESMEMSCEATAVEMSSRMEMEKEESTGDEKEKVSMKTVKKLLELLCDEAGFLIESKLLKLLSPLEKDEQSLMKLDSIFSAMGIESEDDVYKLAMFLMKYKQQWREQAECFLYQQDVCTEESESSAHAEEGDSSTVSSMTFDLIHPDDVLAALKAFTAQHRKSREGLGLHRARVLGLGGRDDSQDAAYWESMADIIPEVKLKVWDALEKALEKYYTVLTERSKLISDTQSLKQQNTELRMLLHQSLNSKVNAELEIPPTQMMQLANK